MELRETRAKRKETRVKRLIKDDVRKSYLDVNPPINRSILG